MDVSSVLGIWFWRLFAEHRDLVPRGGHLAGMAGSAQVCVPAAASVAGLETVIAVLYCEASAGLADLRSFLSDISASHSDPGRSSDGSLSRS
jgi:hypothetical protein